MNTLPTQSTPERPSLRKYLGEDLGLLLLLAVIVGVTFLLMPQLPDQVPIHWNWRGEADGFASKWVGAFMMPLTSLLTYIIILTFTLADPRQDNHAKNSGVLRVLRQGITFYFLTLHAIVMAIYLGYDLSISSAISTLVATLFIFFGNYMGKLRPNYTVGVRLPWTLDSPSNWKRTHRFTGWLWFFGGLSMLTSLALPTTYQLLYMLSHVLVLSLSPIAYSYLIWREEKPG